MNVAKALEAVLFAADLPASVASLAEALEVEEAEIERGLQEFGSRLAETSGLQLVKIAGGYQLCTNPIYARPVAKLLKPQKQRLSRSLLECLAVVAYRQPITLAEIDSVRGVQSDYSIRQLLERRLVREVGRRSTPGRPLLYGTTQQFLHQFAMDDLSQLPVLAEGAQLKNDDLQPMLL